MTSRQTLRRIARDLSRAGAALSAVMLAATTFAAMTAGAQQATGPTPGQTLSVQGGNATTVFAVSLASPNNVCPGDTTTGNYRWNMYLAAAAVDPATVTWTPGTSGLPSAPGEAFVEPMYSAQAGSSQVSKNTAVNTGQITGTQQVNLATNTISGNGQYKLGYSCTKSGITERYWETTITVTDWTSATSFTWAAGASSTTTTTAGATTTTSAGATTTTSAANPTTTVRPTTTVGGATTTAVGAATTSSTTTTTTIVASGAVTTIATSSGFPTGGGGTGGTGNIPATGPSHTVRLVVWSLLLLVFGRMAVLLARPVRVLPPERR